MRYKNDKTPDAEKVQDRIHQTLTSSYIPIYDWMFDAGLHQAELVVYAAIFDILRHEPHKPQRINFRELADRIKYSCTSVIYSVDMLVEHGFLYSKGVRKDRIVSLYPIE